MLTYTKHERNVLMNQRKIAALCSIVIGVSAGTGIVNHYCTGGYKITVEGKTIGYVENSAQYNRVLADVNAEIISDFGHESALNPDAQIDSIIVNKDIISTDDELFNNIAELSDYMTDGYVVTVNGTEVCNFQTEEDANSVLNSILDEYTFLGGTTGFMEDVTCEPKKVSTASISSYEESHNKLSEMLNVKTTVDAFYHVTTDFNVVELLDNTLAKGNRRTVQEGEVGENAVNAIVEYVNGEETNRTIITEDIITLPVNEIVKVGTKEIPGVGTGRFIMPTKGRLTSPFGYRWGRLHRGVDLAASTGTPIYASDRGVVICAEYKNSYGNLVKIDHQNGYVTHYAHCSELLVSEGEVVTQGQLIARVGNTGNSTGPHLHFEIFYNSEPQNPFNYIK